MSSNSMTKIVAIRTTYVVEREIMTKNKECAGTYPVSGYTRSDGTKVDSYTRTCGAKHLGSSMSIVSNINEISTIDKYSFLKYSICGNIQDKIESDKNLKIQETFGKFFPIELVCMDYYKLALDFDHRKMIDKDNSYLKLEEIKNNDIKLFIKKQYKNENISNSTDVVCVHPDAPLMKELIKSDEFLNKINLEKENILNGKYKNAHIDMVFKNNSTLALTLGKCKIYNPQFHKDGTFTCSIIDYYDFSKLSYSSDFKKSIINGVNNNAYKQQQEGRLRNYVIVIPVVIYN